MRILFLESSQIWIHGLPMGFVKYGHEVMISGPLNEKNIPRMIEDFKPDLIISIGWGIENTATKQKWICKFVHEAKVPLIYWAVEDPAFTDSWSMPLIKNMQPDFVFTISDSTVSYYKHQGIKAAYMDFGYEPSIYYPVEVHPEFASSIAVVANAYPDVLDKYPDHYRNESLNILIRPLLRENIRIDFWGRDWDKMNSILGIDIPKEWIHGYLHYKDANYVYNSSNIVIGLQNYTSQVTQRTFEILGSGGFLLTNNTSGVKARFKHGRDLIVSSSPHQTIRLVRYYLKHTNERKSIREHGRSSVKKHSYSHRSQYMLKTLFDEGILHNSIKTTTQEGQMFYYNDYSSEKYELYIVNPGDTLWTISNKFQVPLNELRRLNDLSSDEILVDQLLKIRELNTTILGS